MSFPIFYLNLNRRVDRNEHCIKEFKKASFTNITRIEAMDANEYKLSRNELQYFTKCDFRKLGSTTIKIICNFLGHMKMWKKIIDDNLDYAIICQDDVYFIDNIKDYIDKIIKNMPPDTEIINLGHHEYANYSKFIAYKLTHELSLKLFKHIVNREIGVLHDTINPCSLCYILTKKGAESLLKYTEENGVKRATDWHINDFFNKKGNHFSSLVVLATGDPSFGSDIFN